MSSVTRHKGKISSPPYRFCYSCCFSNESSISVITFTWKHLLQQRYYEMKNAEREKWIGLKARQDVMALYFYWREITIYILVHNKLGIVSNELLLYFNFSYNYCQLFFITQTKQTHTHTQALYYLIYKYIHLRYKNKQFYTTPLNHT